MNQLSLIGTLYRPATYHCTKEARDLLRFTIATPRSQTARADGSPPQTDVHHCQAWGPAALDLHANLKLGDIIMVRGELRYSNHRNRRGEVRRFAELYVTGYSYLGSEQPGSDSRKRKSASRARIRTSGRRFRPAP